MSSAVPPSTAGIRVAYDRHLPAEQVIALYAANGWSSAGRPHDLMLALAKSYAVVTAWDDEHLVGLGNALSDGHLVVYYPHLLVLPTHQGRGIGKLILSRLTQRFAGLHQHVLIADRGTERFYERVGFRRAGETTSMWIYAGGDH